MLSLICEERGGGRALAGGKSLFTFTLKMDWEDRVFPLTLPLLAFMLKLGYMNQDPSQSPRPDYSSNQPQPPQPVQQTETPMDYLNSIAAPTQTKMISPWLLWLAIGGFLAVLLVIGSALVFGGGESKVERYNNFLYRVQSLEGLTKDSAKKIKSSQLLAANGSLSTIIGGAEAEITKYSPSANNKKALKAPKDSPILAEFVALDARLDDARLNVRFDTIYAREVTYQISKLRAEINMVYNETKSPGLQTYLVTFDKDLEGLAKQFTKFDE